MGKELYVTNPVHNALLLEELDIPVKEVSDRENW